MPVGAWAGEDYYHGSPTWNQFWPYCSNSSCPVRSMGYFESLTEASARSVNNRTVCTSTKEYFSNAQDTALTCSSGLAYKSLCGCYLRTAYSRSTDNNPVPEGRARGLW